MRRRAFYLAFITIGSLILSATVFAAPQAKSFDHPVVFEPNKGQVSPNVEWIARGRGYEMFVTRDSATFALFENAGAAERPNARRLSSARSSAPPSDTQMSAIRMTLRGSRRWDAGGLEPTGGVSNYFVGNDSSHWQTNIPHYGRLRVADVYAGIDLVFYDHNGDLEYDFILAPGADPRQIRLTFEGAAQMRVDEEAGDLVLATESGSELRTHRPRVFQEVDGRRVEVAGAYDLMEHGDAVFNLASYDGKNSLVIDPSVTFTTFIHGSAEDIATTIAADNSGNSYVAGWTLSSDLPVVNNLRGFASKTCSTPPTRPNTLCGPYAFIAKLASNGSIAFLTYFGGSGMDMANAAVADATGVYVAGFTSSDDFPTYFGTYKRGGGDVFVTKLSPQGTLIYSSVFGGTNLDEATGIDVDSSHAVYVTGKTKSSDYPVSFYNYPANTPPMQKTFGGVWDAFVTKLNPNGLLYDGYSTYLGGSLDDEGAAITVDSAGYAYVTGITFSKNFPTVGPSFGFPAAQDATTAFVTRLVPDGSSAVYSIYLGGGSDEGNAIALNANGVAYVAGDTASTTFPTTIGAFQRLKPSPQKMPNGLFIFDGFVAAISPGGQLLSATYLGATDNTSFSRSIGLNGSGEVYVAGDTVSTSFAGPATFTPNPTAGYLVKFNSSLSTVVFRMFLGAQINSISISTPVCTLKVCTVLTQLSTEIYTAGFRWVPGSNVSDPMNVDAFAVAVEDAPDFQVVGVLMQ